MHSVVLPGGCHDTSTHGDKEKRVEKAISNVLGFQLIITRGYGIRKTSIQNDSLIGSKNSTLERATVL
ncbi:hypothetical protein CR201_G0041356 [Pongo abelii]|uniref:Uncharacterized protein n=1 Tax=Pongo abelii TaxID=9601 RepID=A0A2J8SQ61_PONAB|nr:hypothetical protein CR201_G0041356 [Pongo abelii]